MYKIIKLISIAVALLLLDNQVMAQQPQPVFSPDKHIKVEVLLHEKLYYRVMYNDEVIMQASPIGISLDGEAGGNAPVMISEQRNIVDTVVQAVWGGRKNISNQYNELQVNLKGDLSIQWRVYNAGVAYRIITHSKKKELIVNNEEVAFRFNFNVSAWVLKDKSYESNYISKPLDVQDVADFNNSLNKVFLPMIVQATPTVKVAITEAGIYNYPSLFLDRGNDYENFLNGSFEKYTLSSKPGSFSNYAEVADKEAGYIARIPGNFELPWRVLIVSDNDAVFADCDLVYLLSKPAAFSTTDWIKPGKVAWDWWHDYIAEGVNFKAGINTATYLYNIDFAARFKLEYIMVDWMWTDKNDLGLFSPDVDIKKIIEYGKSKNVRVLLWCPGHTLYKQLDKALDLFAGIGAAGVKADFFGREDQTGMQMYEVIAAAAAKRKLLVDFHGCTKPTGLSRTYPNVINYEAVLGNEYNKLLDKVSVNHKVMLAFTRALQGPMDYTPGGMRNKHSDYAVFFIKPLVHGTRSNEMALYVIYNEPLVMLCDAPGEYEKEPALTNFISAIPVSWDDTKVLDASFGEYIVTAKKKGIEWHVAGITNDKAREITLDFSFLDEGNHAVTLLKDGINASKIATDYRFENFTVTNKTNMKLPLVAGGGFVLHIK